MKKILAIVGFMVIFGGTAKAAGSSALVPVIESSVTCKTVQVSSSVATDIFSGITMPDRTVVTLQNKDTNNVYCAFDSGDVASNFFILYGSGGAITINVRPYSAYLNQPIKIWCKSTSTSGPSGIAVIQGY